MTWEAIVYPQNTLFSPYNVCFYSQDLEPGNGHVDGCFGFFNLMVHSLGHPHTA